MLQTSFPRPPEILHTASHVTVIRKWLEIRRLLWRFPLCFLRMLWQYREAADFVQILFWKFPLLKEVKQNWNENRSWYRSCRSSELGGSLVRRFVPELFCFEELKYFQNLKANKEHCKYEQGSIDFSSFGQSIRGVEGFYMGGERKWMRACIWSACTGNRKLGGCSGQEKDRETARDFIF